MRFTANGKTRDFAVRFIVDEKKGQQAELVEAEIIGTLNAIKERKAAFTALGNNARNNAKPSISIKLSKFFEDVKNGLNDTFADAVYKNAGMNRANTKFSEKLMYSTAQRDQNYKDAVKRGDMETAQRMVDEAAEKAFANSKVRASDGKLLPVYHGTKADFNVFDTSISGGKNGTQEVFGIYLSDEQAITNQYGDRQISAYLNMEKPAYGFKKTMKKADLVKLIQRTCEDEANRMLEEDDSYSFEDALKDTWVSNYVYTHDYPNMRSVYNDVAVKVLDMNDSDADIIYELMEAMGIRSYDRAMDFYHNTLTPVTGFDGFWQQWDNHETGGKSNVFVAFDSSQIKSNEDVTYDDNGELISLSERFNTEKEDIRFSMNQNVEANEDGLIAYHNIAENQMLAALRLGGFPMPSIAITRTNYANNRYGGISVVFYPGTIDPGVSKWNKVYGSDAWTQTYPTVSYKMSSKAFDRLQKRIYKLVPESVRKGLQYQAYHNLGKNGIMDDMHVKFLTLPQHDKGGENHD